YIENDGIGSLLGRNDERLLGRSREADAMALALQGALQRPAHRLFIVDDQDVPHAFCSRGRIMRKQVRSGSRHQSMRPRWAWATWRATAKPRPMPSRLRVMNGSNNSAAISAGGPGPESATSTVHVAGPAVPAASFFIVTSTQPPGP